MKKYSILLSLTALALLLAACTREAQVTPAGGDVVTLTASVEARTKVNVESGTGTFSWTKGDILAVNTDQGYLSTYALEATSTVASFKVELNGAVRQNFAVFPASAAVAGHDTAEDLQVTLPASYTLGSLSTDIAPVILIAKGNNATTDHLVFKHVGGLFRLKAVDVPKGTDQLVVSFDKDVTGSFTVADPESDNPTIATTENTGKNTVTFTFSALAAMQDVVLNVPVPTGTFGSVTVTALIGGQQIPCSITAFAKDGLAVARKAAFGKDMYMPVFSVSATDKVVFSPGNLEASTTNGGTTWNWAFSEDPYSLKSSSGTLSGIGKIEEESGTIRYFRWSSNSESSAFGITTVDDNAALAGTKFVDWGSNVITWKGNTYAANTWFTPSGVVATGAEIGDGSANINADWNYILAGRSGSTLHEVTPESLIGTAWEGNYPERDVENARFVHAQVGERHGLILFPDHYVQPEGIPLSMINLYNANSIRNPLTVEQFEKMAASGAVFLPGNGSSSQAFYQTSTVYGDGGTYHHFMSIMANSAVRVGYGQHKQQYLVRLARKVN